VRGPRRWGGNGRRSQWQRGRQLADAVQFGPMHTQHGQLRLTIERERRIDQRLIGNHLVHLDRARRRHDEFRTRLGESRHEFGRRETAKDDRMDGAESRSGEHGDDRLGNHGHINCDNVALSHAWKRGEGARETCHFEFRNVLARI
jgi:hypothetical protein